MECKIVRLHLSYAKVYHSREMTSHSVMKIPKYQTLPDIYYSQLVIGCMMVQFFIFDPVLLFDPQSTFLSYDVIFLQVIVHLGQPKLCSVHRALRKTKRFSIGLGNMAIWHFFPISKPTKVVFTIIILDNT